MNALAYLVLASILLIGVVISQDNSTSLPAQPKPTVPVATSPTLASDASKAANSNAETQIPTFVGNYPQKEGSFGWLVSPSKCKNNCSGNGDCHGVYSQFINEKSNTKDTVIIYVCMCKENFIGDSCTNCAKGFYGSKCSPCTANPADGYICGAYGICDDGIQGSGKCLCSSPELEPSLFCESASRKSIHEEEENFTTVFFAVLCILFLSLLVLYLNSKIPILQRFPESIIGLILGGIIGVILRYSQFYEEYLKEMKFDSHTYFLLLLPPIMFQVGFSMNASTFFRNITTINAYAIGGTLLTSTLYGVIVYNGLKYTTTIPYSFMECFQIGCIVSAIDPVATMSIFKSLQVNEKIYMYIFGESTLNNSVVIAICAAIEGIKSKARAEIDMDYTDIGIFSIETFCIYFFGSLIIGGGWALFISFIIAQLSLDEEPTVEIAFFSLSCYFPYILCEAIGCSGVLSIFICGMMMRNYAFYSLNMYSKITIEYMVETIAFTIENFVFAYLGLCIAIYIDKASLIHVGFGMLGVLISRPLSVFLVSFVVNKFKKKAIPVSHQIILSYSGIRGAVAFYLVINMTLLSEEWEEGKLSDMHKSLNMTTVMTIIAFTVIILGCSSRWLMDFLHEKYPEDKIYKDPLEYSDSEDNKSVDFEVKGFYNDDADDKSIGVISRVENFDDQVLQKLLRKYNYDEMDIDPFEIYRDGGEENIDIDDISLSDIQKRKQRQSITYDKSIPLRPVKVQFSLPVEEQKKAKDQKFLSPDPKFQRRSTIMNTKMDSALLNRYSMMKPEQIIESGIDYSASRRKSVLAVKKIAERNERLSISLKSQRERKQTLMLSDKRRTLNNPENPGILGKSLFAGSHTDRSQERPNTPFSVVRSHETEVVIEANEDNEDDEENTYSKKFNNYTMKIKEEGKDKSKIEKKGFDRHNSGNNIEIDKF